MRYQNSTVPKPQPALSESNISTLMMVMSERDGVVYSTFTWLRFSRPALCLIGEHGEQKTLAVENAKAILKEVQNG